VKFRLVSTLTFLILHATGQTLLHSRPETKDFDRFHFHIITRKDNRILIYKAVYFNAVYNENGTPISNGDYGATISIRRSGPNNSIIESTVSVYDSSMQLLSENVLALPKNISGVSFLVYEDQFYLFYQCLRGHTIYCMAATVGLDGQLQGTPICMDSTVNLDINYQSQIYSVIHSEDKEKIMVFKLNGQPGSSTIITGTLFDRRLHRLHSTNHEINMSGGEYLSEFQLDNKGNFLFMGLSHTLERGKTEKAILFTQPENEDSLTYDYILSGKVYLDDIHLLIDNGRGRYILSSFFTQQPQGNVEGLFTQVRDAGRIKKPKSIFTILSDTLRRQLHETGPLRSVFDNFFLQGMHLLGDGSFTLESQQLVKTPDLGYNNRWNNLYYRSSQIGSNFIFYDSYESDHYWPWIDWRQADLSSRHYATSHFNGGAGLIARFDSNAVIQWISRINIPQHDVRRNRLGYASLVADGRLYFIFNENIRHKQFLSGQCIDARGELNTDTRFREDLALQGQIDGYTYYPRLAQAIGDGEIIIPCQNGRYLCLARLRL